MIFGAPYVELEGKTYIVSSSGYTSKIEYSGKGWVSGKKNSFTATLYKTDAEKDVLYNVSGQWTKTFDIRTGKDAKHGELIETYDAESTQTSELKVKPLTEQGPLETRKAWAKVAQGIKDGNMDIVGTEKSRIENEQRAMRKKEQEEGRSWERSYFKTVEKDPLAEQLGAKIGLSAETDAKQTGGIWRFDESKAAAAASKAKTEL